jgi:FkbM family methyltransferase
LLRQFVQRLVYHPIVVFGLVRIYKGMLRAGLAGVAEPARSLLRRIVADRVMITTPYGQALQGGQAHLAVMSLLAGGRYERATLSLFQASLHPGARVLDLGANIGVFTTIAAREIGPKGEVIAVEPDERNLRHLRANVRRLGLNNVDIVVKAVADVTGTALLQQAELPSSSTLYPLLVGESQKAGVVEVPTITIDDLVAGRTVDVIKMDVQGAELAALDGMIHTLEQNPHLILFIELEEITLRAAGSSTEALISRLRSHFAQVMVVDEERRVLVDPDAWNMQLWQNLLCAPLSFIPSLPAALDEGIKPRMRPGALAAVGAGSYA